MRDIAGYDTPTVCNVLGITETNMRVLLHRARAKVRNELERYISETAAPSGTSG
jgi:RNA polymerase sigma-70 factor (ECF subfamily)